MVTLFFNRLFLISNMFDVVNIFSSAINRNIQVDVIKNISNFSDVMDFRPPFENEMKRWVSYILKCKNIQITESAIDEYIQLYGDSIAHVINEAEKMSLPKKKCAYYLQDVNKKIPFEPQRHTFTNF